MSDQSSTWLPVQAGVSQGSILGSLRFLICINYLSNNLSSTKKFSADDTSLFSVVNGVNLPQFHLNSDWMGLSIENVFQSSKQAHELTFSRKAIHPAVFFNDIPVARGSTYTHLGM